MAENKITVVRVEPGKRARIEAIPGSLEDMQQIVGGDIQVLYPFDEEVAIVCNEEAKISGLSLNRALSTPEDGVYDIVAGAFFIIACESDHFCSLTEEQQQRYKQMFLFPEKFVKIDGEIVALRFDML